MNGRPRGEDRVSVGTASLAFGDAVAEWEVRLADGVHTVRLEHGSTSGKRVITVDGKEIYRKNWMFSLVGSESFNISSRPAEIVISCKGMLLEYTLTVEGKALKRFIESQAKNTRVWHPEISGRGHRVVLDIEKMEVYVDGEKTDAHGEFADAGTETRFSLDGHDAYIRATSSGNRHKGLVYTLVIAHTELEPISEMIT